MMDRRALIGGTLSLVAASLAALATPVIATAQPAGELPRIGLLLSFTPVSKITESPGGRAFLEGLRALGWVDGQTVRIETRSRRRVLGLAQRHRLPTFGLDRSFAAAGGLMAVDVDSVGMWRGAAAYVDRILRGARPADLPVEQPTTIDLVINLRTARTLALTIPPSVLARANEVIE